MDMNDFHYTDGLDDVLAAYVNRLMDSTLRSEYKNIETLSADRELTDADTPIQRLDCNGANRVVKVPVGADGNHLFLVINVTGIGAWTLSVKSNDGATTHQVLNPGSAGLFVPDGNDGYKALGAGVSDHGALTGLADDDHSQYLLATGLREWTEQAGDPAVPGENKWKLYFKAGGLYVIDDAGVVIGPLGTGGGGGTGAWTAMPGSPVRASNTTFTVTGDYSSVTAYPFGKCTVFKWTEGGVMKCGMQSIPQTYGAPNTTFTIIGDTMASIDANSLKYYAGEPEKMYLHRYGTIGAVETNAFTPWENRLGPRRLFGCDPTVDAPGTTNSIIFDVNKGGTTMFAAKPTLTSGATSSAAPFTANNGMSLALGDIVSGDVDAITTTPGADAHILLYLFPTRLLCLS